MSGGACTCAVSPGPDRQPIPNAPLPRSESDSLTAVPPSPSAVPWPSHPATEPVRSVPLSVGLFEGFTHNEVQAILGIWRT